MTSAFRGKGCQVLRTAHTEFQLFVWKKEDEGGRGSKKHEKPLTTSLMNGP